MDEGTKAVLDGMRMLQEREEMRERQANCDHDYVKITDTYSDCPECGARMHFHPITLPSDEADESY